MGLSISNPSTTVNSKLLAGKSNTAVEASLGSASLTGTNASTSSYGQVSASLGADTLVTQLVVILPSSSISASGLTYIDVAYGAGGSETVLASVPIFPSYDGSLARLGTGKLMIPARVASGQRLAVRITNPNNLNAVAITVYVYGATYTDVEGN